MKKTKEIALKWWYELEESEQIQLQKDFGYFGHDEGTTEDEVVEFYNYEMSKVHKKQNTNQTTKQMKPTLKAIAYILLMAAMIVAANMG